MLRKLFTPNIQRIERCQHHPIWTILKDGNVAMRKEKVHEKAAIRIAREL